MLEDSIDLTIVRNGATGAKGQSSFKSTVFIRSNSTSVSAPTGGSYSSPVPTTTGWSDGIPSGEAILWASTRIFTSDGKTPQQSAWTTPRQMTDTADFDVEFSSVESPKEPTGHPNTNTQWSNAASEDTIWMAVSTKSNGVWSDWTVSKIKGETGANAIRLDLDNENDSMLYDGAGKLVSSSVVSTPSLYDGTTKVSSGITWSYTVNGCTASQNTSTGKITVTALSSTTASVVVKATYKSVTYTSTLSIKKLVGVDKYDLVLSANSVYVDVNNNNALTPTTITAYVYRTAQNGTRTLVSSLSTYGLTLTVDGVSTQPSYSSGAKFNVSASVTEYTVKLTKGTTTLDAETIPVIKNGKTGAGGKDGTDGITLIYSVNPLELPTNDGGQVKDGPTSVLINYIGGGQTQPTAVTNINPTSSSGLSSLSDAVTTDGNTLSIEGHYVETQAVTYTDAEGNTKTKYISVASGYVDFTCVCGTTTVYGHLPFTAAINALWKSQTATSARSESIYGKIADIDDRLSTAETAITQNADDIALKASQKDLTTTSTVLTNAINSVQDEAKAAQKTADTAKSAANTAQSAADAAQSSADSNKSSIATLTSNVSKLSVEADRISAKTRQYIGINLLATDTALKTDSTAYSAELTAKGRSYHTFYPRTTLTKTNTYRLHLALISDKGGSKITSAVLRLRGTTILATLSELSGVTLNKGVTVANVDFTPSTTIAKGETGLQIDLTIASVATGDTITLYDCALLYDLEQYMLDTGFDIFGHTFQITADNLLVRNNAGLSTLTLDSEGNLIVRGTINNDILTIDTHNEDSYIYDCPYNIDEVHGVVSRSAENISYNKTIAPDKCLDLLRLPSVTIFSGLTPDSSGTCGFLLPYAVALVQSTGSFTPQYWIRTKTRYLRTSSQWMTFTDLRMLVNRTFTFINNGKPLCIGLGSWYYVDSKNTIAYSVNHGEDAVMLGHGETMTVTLHLDHTYGYLWEISGSSGDFATQAVERAFAGLEYDWSLPIGTTLALKTALTPSGGTAIDPINAPRTYQYLSSSLTTGTLLFSRATGGSMAFASSANGYGLIGRETDKDGNAITSAVLRGIPITLGTRHLDILLNQGYYYNTTTWRSLGLRLILWSVSGTTLKAWAQSPRFAVIGNADLLQLDLTQIIASWSETLQCYLAINIEAFTGDNIGSGTITPANFSLQDLGLQITEY